MSRDVWRRAALFAISLFLFILAITLMKEGARGLGPLVRDVFRVTNPANALGFGWIFAYVVMSGSPVAAAALTFLDAGVIDPLSSFAMITGSRLGASFFVLLIGFVYVMRGRNRASSLAMGLLALVVTGITHLTALPVGAALLLTGSAGRRGRTERRRRCLGDGCGLCTHCRGPARRTTALGALPGRAGRHHTLLQPL